MEPICFEPEVFALAKPVVAITTIGILPEGVGEAVRNAVTVNYTLINYQPFLGSAVNASTTTLSTSPLTRLDFDISIEMIRSFLYERPAILIILCSIDTNDQHDGAIATEIAARHAESQESHRQLFVLLYAPDGLATQRKERLGASFLGRDHLIVLGGDINAQLRTALEGAEKPYYKEQSKVFKKHLASLKERDTDDAVLLFPKFSADFKMAYMELFMGEVAGALRAFHSAYTCVVECCRRLSKEEQLGVLKAIRWACDVTAYKVIWILIARRDKREADEYLAGHLSWFAPSFTSPIELYRWKAKMYDSMARILRVQASSTIATSGDYRHLGYYCNFAGEYLYRVVEEDSTLEEPVRLQLLTTALTILAAAYDTFRKRNSHQSVMVVGGKIASIYLHMDSYEKALPYLAEAFLFWKACRAERASSVVLERLVKIYAMLQDPKAQLQYYWEYASINADSVIDSFDEKVREICQSLEANDSIVIDFYRASSNFLKCAIRLEKVSSVADKPLQMHLMISNRSPLIFSLSAVTVCFSGSTFPDTILRPSHDILPGGLLTLSKELLLDAHGRLSIESVTLDLFDLPLRFFFPLGTFSFNDHYYCAPWNDMSVDWDFVKALQPFSEAFLDCQVEPVRAEVQVSVVSLTPLIWNHPCPIKVILKNTTDYDTDCAVRLSGVFDVNVFVVAAEGRLVPFVDHVMRIACPANSETSGTVTIISQRISMSEPLKIYVMNDAKFTPTELSDHPLILCPEVWRHTAELQVSETIPFGASMELQPLPTAAALDPESCHRAGRKCAMVCYRATIRLINSMDRIAILSPHPKLTLSGHENMHFDFSDAYADNHQLSPGGIVELTVDIAYEGPQPSKEGLFYPRLELQWQWCDAYDYTFNFYHDLPALNLYPQSIFIVPVPPTSARVGKIYPISWLVWNLCSHESEIILMIETGDGLIYHGRVQDRLRIPALSCEKVRAAFIPLQIGDIRPPTVSLRAARLGDTLLYETLAVPPIIALPS